MGSKVKRLADRKWSAEVTFGFGGHATTRRRYVYSSRADARAGDISDEPGRRGCVGCGSPDANPDGTLRSK